MPFVTLGLPNHDSIPGVSAADHHAATVAGDLDLADLNARAHADLSDAPADAHHAQTHTVGSHSDGSAFSEDVTIKKAADEAITSSTTLQNDDDFVFAVSANEIWMVEIFGFLSGMDLGGMKQGWVVPTNAAFLANQIWFDDDQLVTNENGGVGDLVVATAVLDSGAAFHHMAIIIVGDTAGNAQFQWAQNNSNADSTVLKEESIMVATRIA